ncbi:MAG: PTS sugar transporter subunit IIB [Gilliamella sp.]|nr:PTS sugar transporter subunit IIB [Gilliamella sp.]
MKKVLVVCGNGIASSSIMVSILQDYLKEKHIDAQVDKSSLMACSTDTFNSYDLVVSSTKIDNPEITTKIIVGAGLLTGIGEEDIFKAVKQELTQ